MIDVLLEMARAQECLRQARNLTKSAATLLAELNIDGQGTPVDQRVDIDLKEAIKLAKSAQNYCQDGVNHLELEIKRRRLCADR